MQNCHKLLIDKLMRNLYDEPKDSEKCTGIKYISNILYENFLLELL